MKKENQLILVTNDDGISAPGNCALIAVMQEEKFIVVAPDKTKAPWDMQLPHKQHVVFE
jgi:broad specificity polyphosphatase/5'/3'-nucleotidase SurE